MPQIEYKPIANTVGADVESQAQYELDLGVGGSLEFGYKTGTAQTAQMNKTLRQSSVMTAAMATFISEVLGGIDVLDDGDVNALKDQIKSAVLNQGWSTGDVKLTMKTVPDAGWIMCDDGTVGKAGSGATHANDANHALFVLLWNNVLDIWAPVVGGRGGSAEIDWAAGKKITLTRMLGRALAISGAGAGGLSARALGQFLGEETHVLTVNELASHNHVVAPGVLAETGGLSGGSGDAIFTSNMNSQNTGGNAPHNNMQPSGFLNAMIKQ